MRRAGSACSWLLLLMLGAGAWGVGPGGALEDPTRPLRGAAAAATPASAVGRPTLSSVLVGPERRFAVIDGRRMQEGDVHRGVKVLEIRSDRVVVSVDGSPPQVLAIASDRMHKEMR